MHDLRKLYWAFWLLPITWAGCSEADSSKVSSAPTPKPAVAATTKHPKVAEEPAKTSEVDANLAKLSPEDRKLAEAQKVCVESDEPLGAMGVPIRILVKDQPVFLCCDHCKGAALKDPDKTLAKLERIKSEATKPQK